MIITRQWAMPNKNTFSIKPISEILQKYIHENDIVIDPFANNNMLGNI